MTSASLQGLPFNRASLAAAILACLLSCTPQSPTSLDRPNVLLITVDTLRRDHLEPYGYKRATSPRLSAFAVDAIVFEDAQSQAPWTLPSLASLMTGLETSAHGCRTFYDALAPSYETLPERLFATGYDTGAVASHVFLGRDYGLDQGFVHFDDELVLEMTRSDEVISSPKVTEKGIAFLEAQAEAQTAGTTDHPFMLWLHYFDPHADYLRHAEISGKFGTKRPVDLYDGEIAFTDRAIGRVLDTLQASGLDKNTIVIFTADHGEEFGDHNGIDHGHTLFAELLDIPLIIRAPGFEPARVEQMVRSIDVANTLCELLGIAPLEESQGLSLVPLMKGEDLVVPASLAELERNAALSSRALVTRESKQLWSPRFEQPVAFNRSTDAREKTPTALNADSEAELQRRLEAATKIATQHADSWRLALGAAERDDLSNTGYAGDE